MLRPGQSLTAGLSSPEQRRQTQLEERPVHIASRWFRSKSTPQLGAQIAPDAYWSLPTDQLLAKLEADAGGLSGRKASARCPKP